MLESDLSQSLEQLKHSVAEHRRTAPKRKHFPNHIVRAALKLADEGVSGEMIGRESGLGASLVYAWIKRRGKKTPRKVDRPIEPRIVDISPPADEVSPLPVTRPVLNLQIAGFQLTIAAQEVAP